MRQTKRCSTVIALSLLLVAACGGDDDPAPHAAVVQTAPMELDPSNDALDDLMITVEYSDGDGDLGEGVVDVHDCRADGVIVTLDIPPIANENAVEQGVAIEGVLEVIVSDVGVVELDSSAPTVCADLGVDAPTAGMAVFCVVLTDSAGNSGEGDCTPAVTIVSAQ